MRPNTGCVSIDLDGLDCYGRIHALHLPAPRGPDPLHTLAVQRFGELLAQVDLLGTAFVIGESLQVPEARQAIKALSEAGHEIGNHSASHDYRLSLRPHSEMAREVEQGAQAIEAVIGRRPEGFRAPGYNLSPELLTAVRESGARYDSSIFPSAPYLAARAAVLTLMVVTGRPSASHPGPALALLAPQTPYRPHRRHFWRPGGEDSLVELPITVLPLLGLPFIGTTLVSLPWRAIREGWRLLRRRPFLNLELHGLDLLDQSDGLPEALAHRQRDLRIPAREKLRRLRAVLEWMKEDRPLAQLEEVARKVA